MQVEDTARGRGRALRAETLHQHGPPRPRPWPSALRGRVGAQTPQRTSRHRLRDAVPIHTCWTQQRLLSPARQEGCGACPGHGTACMSAWPWGLDNLLAPGGSLPAHRVSLGLCCVSRPVTAMLDVQVMALFPRDLWPLLYTCGILSWPQTFSHSPNFTNQVSVVFFTFLKKATTGFCKTQTMEGWANQEECPWMPHSRV